MNVIRILFPTSVNQLCWFHINKSIYVKCNQHVLKVRQEATCIEGHAEWNVKFMEKNYLSYNYKFVPIEIGRVWVVNRLEFIK